MNRDDIISGNVIRASWHEIPALINLQSRGRPTSDAEICSPGLLMMSRRLTPGKDGELGGCYLGPLQK